jgi:hypothetical protein
VLAFYPGVVSMSRTVDSECLAVSMSDE